jgi:hypothetical protein
MFDAWNNAPWTPRGRKVKNTVEAVLMLAVTIALMCEPVRWNS